MTSFMTGLSIAACLLLAACSGADGAHARDEDPIIRSTDFVLLPCAVATPERPCLQIVAGGKRLLFGAPEGVSLSIDKGTLPEIEAVMLFALTGPHIEGLDGLRNASWLAGRDAPLRVYGPEGIEDVLDGLNAAYEISDAALFVEEDIASGFDDALLVALSPSGFAFDTGDLRVTALPDDADKLAYLIDYEDKRVLLVPCGFERDVSSYPGTLFSLACEGGDSDWPLAAPHFVRKDN